MSKNLFRSLLLSAAMIAISPIAQAEQPGDVKGQTIDQLIEAYGGKQFTNMESIAVYSDFRQGWFGQSYSSDFVELAPWRYIYQVDLKGERVSEEVWIGLGAYSNRVIATNENRIKIDYNERTYNQSDSGSYYGHFGVGIRNVDTLLAFDLVKHRDKVSHQGQKKFQGRPHDILKFQLPESSKDLHVWVNSDTGLISKMHHDISSGTMRYIFSSYRETAGVTYADDILIYANDHVDRYYKKRAVKINGVKEKTFRIDRGFKPEPEKLDQSIMSVDELTPIVHHVGKGSAYGTIVDAGSYLISIGGYGGLKDRLKAYREKHGNEKPLRYQIVTHHHLDHIGGTAEALELGAIIVTPRSALPNLEIAVGAPILSEKLKILSAEKEILGPVEIYLISTTHAELNAVTYIPSAKAIFQADHYNAQYKSHGSYVSHFGMSFKHEIERLGLDVDYLYSAHTRKAEPWAVFESMAAKHIPGPCPTRRKICRDF